MRGVRSLVIVAILLIAAGGCRESDEQEPSSRASAAPASVGPSAGSALAVFGESVLTVDEFADLLAATSSRADEGPDDPKVLERLLDDEIRFRLLAREAQRRGYDRHPKLRRRFQQLMVEAMMNELFGQANGVRLDITDEEVRAYYDANVSEFVHPAQRRAGYARFEKSVGGRAQATALIAAVSAHPDDKERFRRLAAELARSASPAVAAGDLGFFFETPVAGDEGPPLPVRRSSFDLERNGEVSPEPIEAEDGYYVVQLTGSRPALHRSLDDAKRLIQSRLHRRKRDAAIDQFVRKLRADANVRENFELLDEVRRKVRANAADPGKSR